MLERAIRSGALVLSGAWVLALAACSPETEGAPGTGTEVKFPRVSGTWSYSATDVRLAGSGGDAPCQITGLVLEIDQFRNSAGLAGEFEGRASGGTLACRGELGSLGGALQPYRVWQGHAGNGYIGFNIGTHDWRHDGSVAGDSMSGNFVLKHGSLSFEGKFAAKRTAR